MEKRRFDLVLQMHGDGRFTNPLVSLMGAAAMAGFYVPGRFCPDPERFLEWRPPGHEGTRFLPPPEHLRLSGGGTQLEVPLPHLHPRESANFGPRAEPDAPGHPGAQL